MRTARCGALIEKECSMQYGCALIAIVLCFVILGADRVLAVFQGIWHALCWSLS